MEHEVFGLPRPDLILYLNLSRATSQKLLADTELQDTKEYREGRVDQTEIDQNYLALAREGGVKLVAEMNNWVQVDCDNTTHDGIRTREEIHEDIYQQVKSLL